METVLCFDFNHRYIVFVLCIQFSNIIAFSVLASYSTTSIYLICYDAKLRFLWIHNIFVLIKFCSIPLWRYNLASIIKGFLDSTFLLLSFTLFVVSFLYIWVSIIRKVFYSKWQKVIYGIIGFCGGFNLLPYHPLSI